MRAFLAGGTIRRDDINTRATAVEADLYANRGVSSWMDTTGSVLDWAVHLGLHHPGPHSEDVAAQCDATMCHLVGQPAH